MGCGKTGVAGLALLLVASGCGVSSEPVESSAGDATTISAETALAAEALVDQWGSDRDAFYVVAWSLDGGYSAGQVIDAAPDGLIRADGTIADADGLVAAPDHEPAGLLVMVEGEAFGSGVVVAAALPARGLAMRLLADDRPRDAEVTAVGLLSETFDGGLAAFEQKLAELRAQAEEDDPTAAAWQEMAEKQAEAITWITLGLSARGYSGRQILEAILLRQWDVHRADLNYCWRVFSSKGKEILPEYGTADPLLEMECALEEPEAAESSTTSRTTSTTTSATTTTTTTTSEAPLAFPRTYSGAGKHTFSTSVYEGSCVTEGHQLEVTLLADGTVTASWITWGQSYSGSSAPEGEKGTIECLDPTDPVTVTLEGRHESGHVVLYREPGDVNWEGDFTPGTLVIDYQYETAPFGNDVVNWLEFDYLLEFQDG
jgi:hypothetical protein